MFYLAILGLVFISSMIKGVLAPLVVFCAYLFSVIAIINKG